MIEIAKNKVVIGKNIYRLIRQDGSIIENPVIEGLSVEFSGRMGGTVEIEEGAIFKNTKIRAGGAGFIHIRKTHSKGIKNTTIETVCPCKYKYLFIDEGCSIESARFALVNDDDLVLKLGKDCMLSSNITFRSADGHTIFDINSGDVINSATPIIIGDHVWIGSDSTFLKGSRVANNSIVGTHSIVVGEIAEENVAIAGVPAKVVKSGINWDRDRICEFRKRNNKE